MLRRLEREEAVVSEWEDVETASEAGRRRRRVYQLTPAGELRAERARRRLADTAPARRATRLDPVTLLREE